MAALIRSLSDLLETSYGVKTTIRESEVSVGTVAGKILSYNPRRVGLVLTNQSAAAAIRFTPSKFASSTKGVALLGNGASVALRWDQDFEMIANEFFAIASVAASALYILEVIIQTSVDEVGVKGE